MDLAVWLRSLGLEKYEAAFRENEITEKVLPNLTAEDLKDLGVSVVGHRRTLLDAIAALRVEADAKASLPETSSPRALAKDTAERRQRPHQVRSRIAIAVPARHRQISGQSGLALTDVRHPMLAVRVRSHLGIGGCGHHR